MSKSVSSHQESIGFVLKQKSAKHCLILFCSQQAELKPIDKDFNQMRVFMGIICTEAACIFEKEIKQ